MLNLMKLARARVSSGTTISCDDLNWQNVGEEGLRFWLI